MIPLVLLPGMMCDERLFAPQIAALAGRIPVRALPISDADNMEDLAAMVLRDAPDRFALAGLSMGGIVAMEVVRQEPDRVDKLALLDTNPFAEDAAKRCGRAEQIEKAVSGHLAEVIRDDMKPNYLVDGPDRASILDLCMDMALVLGPDVFVRQSVALRDRSDQSETLRSYRGKALVLCGEADALCPVARHEAMHQMLPNSTLSIIGDAAHLPTLEQPDATNAALFRWLED